MKKFLAILLVVCATAAVIVSCAPSTPADSTSKTVTDSAPATTTEAATQEITVPDVTLTYLPANVSADKATAEANGLTVADNSMISGMFKETTEIDETTWEIKIPEEFTRADGYVFRVAQGQYIEEVTVIKVKDAADVEAVKALAEYRLNKQKNNGDFKLYDDENGTNAKMIDTGKVVATGNFVIYAVTQNTEASVLRAQKYVEDNPNCTAFELYKAIVKELF